MGGECAYSKGPLLRNFTYKNPRTTFWGRWLRTFRTAQTREFLSPTVLAQRALIDSMPTVIMHSAMVAMVHPPHGGAAPTPSCLVGPRRKEILPFLASNSKKKWSFSELRTFFPKNLSYRRVDVLRNLRSRGKLQSFLRVGLYCTAHPSWASKARATGR